MLLKLPTLFVPSISLSVKIICLLCIFSLTDINSELDIIITDHYADVHQCQHWSDAQRSASH